MSPRALANQSRELQVLRLSKFGRSILMLLATVLSFATIALLIADQLYKPDAFVIDQLKIKGKFRYLQPSDVEQIVRQENLGNFFSIDLNFIKHQVESLAWVQSSDVRREWPNTLSINIKEHRPLMPFNNDEFRAVNKVKGIEYGNYWLTSQGHVVELPDNINLKSSIVLSGNERDSELILKQTYEWKKITQNYNLNLIEVSLSDSQSWKLRLSYMQNEFDVLLGRTDVEQRLSRFLFLFDSQFKAADKQLTHVDARYPNGLAVTSEPAANDDQLALMKFTDATSMTENTLGKP